jgi:1,4-dihydroxy-6-naphthoate synthase
MPYVRAHAQELSEDVTNRHIGLYVNEHTVDIGDDGQAALEELLKRADMVNKPL